MEEVRSSYARDGFLDESPLTASRLRAHWRAEDGDDHHAELWTVEDNHTDQGT